MSRFRFVFVTFYIAALLIFTVYLRSTNNRIFYKLSVTYAEQDHLKQQLWRKQLRLEGIVNPAAIEQRLGE